MDSILNSSLEEICSEGPEGLPLQTLLTRLDDLSPHLHHSLWQALLSVPALQIFHTTKPQNAAVSSDDPSIQSFHDAEKRNVKLVADRRLRNSFLGLYDVESSTDAICAYQRKTLERVAGARSTGIAQSQLSKELGIRGENFFYKLKRLECRGLIAKQPLSAVSTNLVYLNRYAKHLGLGLGLGSENKVEVDKSNEEEEECETMKKCNLIAELPIEHQIYEMVNDAGSRGMVVIEVAERLGINKKENRKRIESLCSTYGMVMEKEKCKKNKVYRVWGPGRRNDEAPCAVYEQSGNVIRTNVAVDRCSGDQALSAYDSSTLKGDTAIAMGSNTSSERLEQLQDKGHGLQSQELRSPSQKRKRSSKARSPKFIEGREVTVEHPGPIDDVEEKCAFSTPTSTCQIRFSWTEQANRQLVIQYVRRCATLGAKYRHQINWASLSDLPAPLSTCKRRMSYLKIRNGKFRKSLMMLCNILSKRYANFLQKMQNGSLSQDGHDLLLHGSTGENYNRMCFISDHGTGLPEEQWDDFDDNNVKEALNEVLYHLRLTKSDASKRLGPTAEEGSELNTNAEDNVMGSDEHPSSFSPQVFPSIVKSPYPNNSGKRAAKFARWLHKRHELMTGGIDLPTDVQCGDLFHLFALVSSGELSISPFLPDGVGEAQKLRSSQHKIGGNEYLNGKRLKSLVKESEITSCREKGFPSLMVSLCRTSFSIVDCENLHTSGQNEIRKTINSGIDAPVPEVCSESPGEGDLHPVICNGGAHPQRTRNMHVSDVHKVTILKEAVEHPSENRISNTEGKISSPRGNASESFEVSFAKSCINGDKTMDEGLSRRLFAIVMQNPGIVEAEIIRRMDALNPQSCRELLGIMIEAKHLHVRTIQQAAPNVSPAFLGTLFGSSSLPQPKVISCMHFFANSMSTFLL